MRCPLWPIAATLSPDEALGVATPVVAALAHPAHRQHHFGSPSATRRDWAKSHERRMMVEQGE